VIYATTKPNTSRDGGKVTGLEKIRDVAFLRLLLSDVKGAVLSRNVYWITQSVDALNWDNSTWYHTPVTKFANFSPLGNMQTATLNLRLPNKTCRGGKSTVEVINTSPVPAFFIRLNLVDKEWTGSEPCCLARQLCNLVTW
jgi:exo-1,4-beta-D-glucosaminidase